MTGLAQLDALVDAAVTGAEVSLGVRPEVSASRSGLGRRAVSVLRRGSPRPVRVAIAAGRWSPEEKECVRACLGRAPLPEIALALGRTVTALKILRKREGWPAPSKMPAELTAHRAGRLIGVDPKLVTRLIDLGILGGRVLPDGRNIHVVTRVRLECWLTTPRNWIYFRARKVKDLRLRRLVLLAQSRWPDRWLTPRQAAAVIGCHTSNVNDRIHEGKLPAVHWNNWRILESDARRTVICQGRGQGHELPWPPAADAFMVLAHAGGVPRAVVARMMGPAYSVKRIDYRLRRLHVRGLLPGLIARFQIPVVYDPATGRLSPGPGFRPRWRTP